jgi:mutator protein MutT
MSAVFMTPPADFNAKVTVAGCYCEFEDKILLLKRHPKKPAGHSWGLPGGKIDEGETPREAVVREVFEEIGLQIPQNELEEIDQMYVRGPNTDYIFYRFRKRFEKLPEIDLNLIEHTEARWITIDEALTYPLIYGGTEALLSYQQYVNKKAKIG